MIFDVHQMMLDDLDYIESIRNMIETQKVNAEFAVATTGDNFVAMFSGMDDAYMKERAADVKRYFQSCDSRFNGKAERWNNRK